MDSQNQNNKPRTALVTGASGGIGLELARLFAQDGYNLVLVARNSEKLAQLASELEKRHSISAKTVAIDLSEHDSPEQLYSQLQTEGISVDVLVNNAGFTVFGRFLETPLQDELQMMQVNMVTLTHLTKLFLPQMVERGWGKILNLASTAAFQPGPLMAVYYASKSYVLSFSEAIANELQGTGVTVTALCPGPTRTGFQKRGNMEDSRLVAGREIMSAKTVARVGYRALMKGQQVVIPGFTNWLFAEAVRFAPRKLSPALVRRLQERV